MPLAHIVAAALLLGTMISWTGPALADGPSNHLLLAQQAATPAPTPTSPAAPAQPAATAGGSQAGETAAAQNPEAQVDERITQLHDQLQIKPEQQAKWDAFAKAMHSNVANDEATELKQREDNAQSMTALDDLRAYEHLIEGRAADVKKLTTAFASLYNSMSSEQRKNADQVFLQSHEQRMQGRPK